MLRGANGQCLEALEAVVVRGFLDSVKVQFRAVVTGDARVCSSSGTQLRSLGNVVVLRERGSNVTELSSGTMVWMAREGNRDTLKLACWHRMKN